MILKYTGNGVTIPHIPARDLDDSDITRLIEGRVFVSADEAIDLLTKRGIYSKATKARKPQIEAILPDSDSEETDS